MLSSDIQALLKEAGTSQKEIAQEYGCSEFHVSRTINTGWGSEPLMAFIAKKINKEPKVIFPGYFGRENKRLRKAA